MVTRLRTIKEMRKINPNAVKNIKVGKSYNGLNGRDQVVPINDSTKIYPRTGSRGVENASPGGPKLVSSGYQLYSKSLDDARGRGLGKGDYNQRHDSSKRASLKKKNQAKAKFGKNKNKRKPKTSAIPMSGLPFGKKR